jgi:tetratricopeptide (TPR) repeat protein
VNEEVSQPSQLVELATVPVPQLFFTLLSKRFTGVATLMQPEPDIGERMIWFRGGMPVLTDWRQDGSRLGELAVAQGLVGAAAVKEALTSAQERRLGEVLVERGLLEHKKVLSLLRAQCTRRLIDVFGMGDGLIAVAACEVETDLLQINVLDLIQRGISSRWDVGRVRRELKDNWSASMRATSAYERYVESFNFRPEDGAMLAFLGSGGSADIAALSKMPDATPQRAAQVVCTLWFCRMLESTAPPPTVAVSDYVGDPNTFLVALASIEASLASSNDPAVLLELSNDADTKAIDRAYEKLSSRFDPAALPADADRDLRERVAAVAEGLVAIRDAARSRRHTLAEMAGLRMVREGKLVRALALLDEAAGLGEVGPQVEIARAWCRLHTTARAEADLKRADTTLAAIVAQHPDLAEGFYYRGFVLSGLGKPNEAIAAFRKALELDERLVDAERQLRALQRGERAVAQIGGAKKKPEPKETFLPLEGLAERKRHRLLRKNWRALYWAAAVALFVMIVANIVLRLDYDF